MSETIVLGILRAARVVAGVLFFLGCIAAAGGLLSLFDLHKDARLLGAFVQDIGWLVATFAAHWGLTQLIHHVHRSKFGKPHPTVRGLFSI